MDEIHIWVLSISLILLLHTTNSADEAEKQALLNFYQRLSNGTHPIDPDFGWNASSDPCSDRWNGITCNSGSFIKKVALEGLSFNGILDANSICTLNSLTVFSIQNNSIHGEIPTELANCKQLTHLYVNDNRFSGSLPPSLSRLNNLKRLFLSSNSFSGELPDFARISGLVTFLAQNNQFRGEIPAFDFSNLQQFNVSFNNFSGPVPELNGRFNDTSLLGNPSLCGKPLPKACPPSSPPMKQRSKSRSVERILMYLGYILLALVFFSFIVYRIIRRKKKRESKSNNSKTKKEVVTESKTKASSEYSGYKTGGSRSEFSIPSSTGSGVVSSALVILSKSKMRDLTFEELLKAPAELLGRGRYGSLYKVTFEDETTLAVKRIKDWTISSGDFRRRMEKVDKVRHPNVLPAMAFYCSKQEKLVVYEYQQNGSLFNFLHGTQSEKNFDWGSRLSVAASLGEGLAFMHKELYEDGISHGNLKSSNILINNSIEPCISEYGLMVIDNKAISSVDHGNSYNAICPSPGGPSLFKDDVYNFGVILLELLTGKLVQTNGFDLATWVHSVVREEWTVEVFDKALIAEGANEERMVNLLQVALKCIDPSPEARPSSQQVANMISIIKEDDDRSIVSET
ncbi:probable inactive receptor kinase At2g26730 [Magnolia sinica]|uniref:probable inactive receptor kinase At2g26730 n=1 Tax=Magnolia sinica TaxID=86752 RepID=UPI002659D93D|nr:probable inactive receptor kinase At2g26730 [Magnolia sinica]